jgi:hypothetical protein
VVQIANKRSSVLENFGQLNREVMLDLYPPPLRGLACCAARLLARRTRERRSQFVNASQHHSFRYDWLLDKAVRYEPLSGPEIPC